MATLKRSRQASGRARPRTYEAKIKTHCSRHDLKANLYLEISGLIEQLEPGQKLREVVVEVMGGKLGYNYNTTTLKIPGRVFLDMALDGVEEMSKALCLAVERIDNDAEARLKAEARHANPKGYAAIDLGVDLSGSAMGETAEAAQKALGERIAKALASNWQKL